MPRATTVSDQANLERRLWDLLEARPQAIFDMSRPATVTVVSGAVSTLTDATGRYSVTQATSADRPTYTQNAQNGQPVATGNGTGQRLASTTNTGLLNNVPGVTLYVIGRATADTVSASRRLITISTTSASSTRLFLGSSAAGTGYQAAFRRLDADAAFLLDSGTTTGFSQYRTTSVRFDALTTTNNVTINENGTQSAIGTRTGTAANTSATNPANMTILGDGASATATGPFAFGAAAVFHEAHPLWLRQKAEGRMAHNWAMEEGLAVGHPCRSRPPLLGPG